MFSVLLTFPLLPLLGVSLPPPLPSTLLTPFPPLPSPRPACPQAVSCLAFSESGGILLSGGEDTMASAWLLADVLDGTAGGGGAAAAAAAGGWQAQGRVEPLHSWWVGVVVGLCPWLIPPHLVITRCLSIMAITIL